MMKPKIRFNGFTDDWEQRKLGIVNNNGTLRKTIRLSDYIWLRNLI